MSKSTHPKSRLSINDANILLDYITKMENIIVDSNKRLPVTIDVVTAKTLLIALTDGN